jgi:hypothetical protein
MEVSPYRYAWVQQKATINGESVLAESEIVHVRTDAPQDESWCYVIGYEEKRPMDQYHFIGWIELPAPNTK